MTTTVYAIYEEGVLKLRRLLQPRFVAERNHLVGWGNSIEVAMLEHGQLFLSFSRPHAGLQAGEHARPPVATRQRSRAPRRPSQRFQEHRSTIDRLDVPWCDSHDRMGFSVQPDRGSHDSRIRSEVQAEYRRAPNLFPKIEDDDFDHRA